MGIRCPRHRLPLEVGDEMKQALLGYSPVVVAPLADPTSKLAEALEVFARDLSEQFCHVRHKLEWRQFLNICPLAGLPFGHYPQKLVDGHVPFILVQGTHLSCPAAADYLGEVSLPP